MRIRERVEVRAQPTVVRLEESAGAAWITEAYHLTDEVRAHIGALQRVLAGPAGAGAFLIAPYGSGKSHFLAYLTQRLRAGDLRRPAPEVVPISLLNYGAEARLEEIIARALDIPVGSGDRRPAWSAAMDRRPAGLVLVVDELSEFLRSKPDARRFTEDVRFLQFMGEWAQDCRLFVVAAMQEAIEHAGDLEYDHYRKLKDRYPLRLRLTPAHVRDLIARHVLIKKPGYEEDATQLARRLAGALPAVPRDLGGLADVYPLHPATLDLLEEVRDRFSQTRGVVDFVVKRLGGDDARGIAPFLDREWGALLTPDAIVDHFADVLEVQAEFLPIAQKLLPWCRRSLGELFDTERLRELADRLIKLLVVAHLAPARRGITVDEASWWLLFAPARIDPGRNREILARTLEKLATEGRYVRREDDRFVLDLQDDSAAEIERLLARELAQLPADDTILECLGEDLAGASGPAPVFHPFGLPRDRWLGRVTRWCFHDRPTMLWVGDKDPSGFAARVRGGPGGGEALG
ncbi:MAG: DUF6079 family protein, partial [Myxococcota bacterium]|nr:DUF6079 family protein [Myxococcota bacterium]